MLRSLRMEEGMRVMLGALLLVAGCAHQPGATATVGGGLDKAYETVASGASQAAHGGGYLVEKAGDRSVRVLRESPAGGLGRDVSDAWITAKVKGRLGLDPDTKARHIKVETDAGL